MRIGSGPDGPEVQVLRSPEGERARCRFESPLEPGELERIATAFGRHLPSDERHLLAVDAGPEPVAVHFDEVGRRLFRSLFRGPVRYRLHESLAHVRVKRTEGLRIKLRLDLSEAGVAPLHALPWELLTNPEELRPLALSRRTPVVRYLEVPGGVVLLEAPEALEVLLVAPQPRGASRLDLDREERRLRDALSSRARVTIRRLETATLEGLTAALRIRDVHVLHFMGHGELDRETGEGLLLFEGVSGEADRVSGRRLVEQVGDFLPAVRIAFLNACRSAAAVASAPFAGVATALVEAGLGAVIAMQYPVSDAAAARFAGRVYERLALGVPVDEAVTDGRLAVADARGCGSPDLPEWATPALFLRVPDGRLFAASEGSAGTAAVAPRWRTRRRAFAWAAGWACAVLLAGLLYRGASRDPAPPESSDTAAAADAYGETGGAPPAESREVEPGPGDARGAGGRPGETSKEPVGSAPPAVRELSDGQTVYLREAGATVTADFITEFRRELVRLTVAPAGDGKEVQKLAAAGPTTLVFRWGSDSLSIHVLSIDRTVRTVRLRAVR